MPRGMLPCMAICFIFGALSGLCLIFATIGPAVFVLLAPALALILREDGAKRSLFLCASLCLGLCAGAYSVGFSIRPSVEPNLVFWVDLSVYLAACLLHGAVLTAGLWCSMRLPLRGAFKWAAIPVFWTFSEWLCEVGPFAWPALRLCLTLWRYPVFIQTSRVFGSLFISALIMAVNLLLARALCMAYEKKRRALMPFAAAVSLFAVNALYGAALLCTPLSGGTLSVAAVQTGQPPEGQGLEYVYESSLRLALEAARSRPALILTAENSTPPIFVYDAAMQAQWGEAARESGGDMLLGGSYAALWDALENKIVSPTEISPAQVEEKLADGEPRYSVYTRSAAYLFDAGGTLRASYQKRREVPFFENGQGGQPFVWRARRASGLIRGERVKLGVLICYESLFSSMAREEANEGAQILTVTTNDARFGMDAVKEMHLAHGIFRAVETGLPLIQAGRNGYTAAVDSRGRVTAALPLEDVGVLHAQLRLTPGRTPYLIWGDGWLFLCLSVCVLLSAAEFLKKAKYKA